MPTIGQVSTLARTPSLHGRLRAVSDDASIPPFKGTVPEMYDTLLVPMIFEAYTADLVERLRAAGPANVLELAAGTGVLSRAMASGLAPAISIVATDLAPPMLARAQAVGTSRPVEWRTADALDLPFSDGSFDAVACQFGVMFLPDRPKAFGEAARVLRPGGTFAFSVWRGIEDNEFAQTVEDSVSSMFPGQPLTFASHVPHGYHDEATITADLVAAGFVEPIGIDRIDRRSLAATADAAARAFCHGTPMRDEIENRRPGSLDEATTIAAQALEDRFGAHDLGGLISALVVTASTPN